MTSCLGFTGLETALLSVLQQMLQPLTDGNQGMPFESFDPTVRTPHVWTDLQHLIPSTTKDRVEEKEKQQPPQPGTKPPDESKTEGPPAPTSSGNSPQTPSSVPPTDGATGGEEKNTSTSVPTSHGDPSKSPSPIPPTDKSSTFTAPSSQPRTSFRPRCSECKQDFKDRFSLESHIFFEHGDGFQGDLTWGDMLTHKQSAPTTESLGEFTVQNVNADGKCMYRAFANHLVMDAYGINLGGESAGFRSTLYGKIQTRLANQLNKLCLDMVTEAAKDEKGNWYDKLKDRKIEWLEGATFEDLYQADHPGLDDQGLRELIEKRLDANAFGSAWTLDVLEAIFQRPIHVWRMNGREAREPIPHYIEELTAALCDPKTYATANELLEAYNLNQSLYLARNHAAAVGNQFLMGRGPECKGFSGTPIHVFHSEAHYKHLFVRKKDWKDIPIQDAIRVSEKHALQKNAIVNLKPLTRAYCEEYLFKPEGPLLPENE